MTISQEQANAQARIDYLTFTARDVSIHEVVNLTAWALNVGPAQIECERKDYGALGWERQYRIGLGGETLVTVLEGGESQRGYTRVEMRGQYCSSVYRWEVWERYLKAKAARITRVDICADFLTGEYSVDDALQAWSHRGFSAFGRPPAISQMGNWITPDGRGRTLYVGSRANGKMWRVYEKGRQLGDESSKWTRWELELRNTDRLIPHDVLSRPEEYFAGAAPIAKSIIKAAAQVIRGITREATTRLEAMLYHARKSYGKVVQYLHLNGVEAGDIVRALAREIGDQKLPWMSPINGLSPETQCRAVAAAPF